MKRHSKSFFGQKTGMILDSADWDNSCIFLTFIKKISEEIWEKPSENQGKKIKLNLGEIVMIQKVLLGIENKWSTVHKFNDEQTSISFSKDQKENNQFWINVGKYNKNLRPPESDLFQLLLHHILDEKIEKATGMQEKIRRKIEETNEISSKFESNSSKTLNKVKDSIFIKGQFRNETEKAILVYFEKENKEIWIPKSTIQGEIKQTGEIREFIVEKWIVEKNGIIAGVV